MKAKLIYLIIKFTGNSETQAYLEALNFTQTKDVYSRNTTNDLTSNLKLNGVKEITYGFNRQYIIESLDLSNVKMTFETHFKFLSEEDNTAKCLSLEPIFIDYKS